MKMTRMRQVSAVFVLFFLFLSSGPLTAGTGGMIRDAELEDGLSALARPLAIAAGFDDGIIVRIIIDPDYNAYVTGGRTIYIHSGLLLKARSAEEILGVIAHEIGHLAAGHVPLRAEAIQEAGLATALASLAAAAAVVAGSPDAAVGLALGGIDQGQRRYLKTSRRDESIADEWALRLLDEAQISSAGLADFMRRLAGQRALPETRQTSYYSSHPGAADRLSVFNDHSLRTRHEARSLSPQQLALMARLVLKLSAYVNLPEQTLQNPYEISWPRRHGDTALYQPGKSATDYQHAIATYRRGQLDLAAEQLARLTAAHSKDPYFLEFAGDIEMARAAPQRAADFYTRALAEKNEHPLISLSLGRALIAANTQQELLRAITVLEGVREKEPDWAFVMRQLAIAYGRTGQTDKADILLAEEALLHGDKGRATALARRVAGKDNADKNLKLRALDILFELDMPLSPQ